MSSWGFGMYSLGGYLHSLYPNRQGSGKRKRKRKIMATEKYYFEGKCKWAKVFKPDTKYAPGAYKIDIYLDKEGRDILKKTGLKLKVKEDDDGFFVTFQRKLGKWPDGNEIGAPEVLDSAGAKFEKLIGNDSEVAVEVSVYQAGDFKGHRLNKVVVTKHVPYEKDEAGEAEESKEPGKAKPKGLPF